MFASPRSPDGGGRRPIGPNALARAEVLIKAAREAYDRRVLSDEDVLEFTDADQVTDELRAAIGQRLRESADQALRQLNSNDAAETLAAFEVRFKANMHLHEDADWDRVKTALDANPEALWAINKMQAAGHDPDIYNWDATGFDIGTCTEEVPETTRGCVYDNKAAVWLAKNSNLETFSGTAVEMAEALGISLMTFEQYQILQRKGAFDSETRSWMLTDSKTRQGGNAFDARRLSRKGISKFKRGAIVHSGHRGWRGTRRIEWAA